MNTPTSYNQYYTGSFPGTITTSALNYTTSNFVTYSSFGYILAKGNTLWLISNPSSISIQCGTLFFNSSSERHRIALEEISTLRFEVYILSKIPTLDFIYTLEEDSLFIPKFMWDGLYEELRDVVEISEEVRNIKIINGTKVITLTR